MRDKKLHAALAQSTFPSQKFKKTGGADHAFDVQMSKKSALLKREVHVEAKSVKTGGSDHFLTLRSRKSARSCGAKHMSKPKV